MLAARSYVPAILRLAGPVALARLGIIAMGLVDTVVVGQLAPDELPYQALGWAPTAVFLVASIGLLQGVQVLAARSLGEKNLEGAGTALKRGLVLALGAGVAAALMMVLCGSRIFTVFGIGEELALPSTPVMLVLTLSLPLHLLYVAGTYFLEAIKKPGIGVAVMWGANLVNLLLNLWWVPEHGAVGSAWATVGARVFLAGVLLVCIICLRDAALYGLRKVGGSGPSFNALLAVGIAAAVSQAVEAGAFSAMTVIAGRISADTVSVYQIILNLMAFIFMVAVGVGTASSVFVSEAIGRRAPDDAIRSGWTGIALNAAAMLLAALLIFVLRDAISRFYTADVALAGMIASLIWLASLALLPDGSQVVLAAVLRARGDNWFPTFSHIFSYAVVMPALGYWLAEVNGWGVAGLIAAIAWSSVVSAGILLLRWWSLSRRSAIGPIAASAP